MEKLIFFEKAKFFVALLLFCFVTGFSQKPIEKCKLSQSHYENIYSVTSEDVKCLAQNSDQPNTLFFTFGSWCTPCIYHIPTFFVIKKFYNVDLYVLLVDPENHNLTKQARDMVLEAYPDAKILVIKDIEGRGKSKKYKDFLTKITPAQFENIDDMSKFIVLNKKGEVQLVTNYQDSKNDPDWKDDKPMVKRIVLPLLEKKETTKE
ncbi:MAG: hypothetical protein EOO44_19965 [Flavobacterium sp.]|nr:MAG: hypothetical protein EOO44_19965 [Flavobacterium sp.]